MAHIECICPALPDGTPRHPEGDTVTLRPSLGFRGAIAARNTIAMSYLEDPESSEAAIFAGLSEVYLVNGIESWTVVDQDGDPVAPTKSEIRARLLSHPMTALAVVDEADALYTPEVVLPLLDLASTSSPPSPTNASTSVPTASPTKPPTPSKPSSTSTSPMDDTETTSPSLVGASSS